MTLRQKLFDDIVSLFLFIGVFGWFFVIWIEEYRWRLFFTCLLCLVLAFTVVGRERMYKESKKKKEDSSEKETVKRVFKPKEREYRNRGS